MAQHYMKQRSRQTPLTRAAPQISALFDAGQRLYTRTELHSILQAHRKEWALPKGLQASRFINFLTSLSLRKIVLRPLPSEYRSKTLFAWGAVTPLEVALATRSKSYLSHRTAAQLYGLLDESPDIYVNSEQRPKPSSILPLQQYAIDRAFQAHQRSSNYVFQYKKSRLILLSGKYTNDLGVADFTLQNAAAVVRATNIERTLIDLTVRPEYGGGIHKVAEAYRQARDRISAGLMFSIYSQMDLRYPYFQSIGFLMERAGFKDADVQHFRNLPRSFDFYLGYRIPEKIRKYNSEWRLFYPGTLLS